MYNIAEEREVRVPGGQELPSRQAATEPLPVLQIPEGNQIIEQKFPWSWIATQLQSNLFIHNLYT